MPSIERWFLSRGRTVELAANDLCGPEKFLQAIGLRFAAIGLTRRREILVAERGSRITGFALLEVSSLGMNFSELTNAFTIHMIESDSEGCLGLAQMARQRYGQLGREYCVALDEGACIEGLESGGFVRMKVYECWTFHRCYIEQLAEHFRRTLVNRNKEALLCT